MSREVQKIGQLCEKVGHIGEKKADQRYEKVIRNAVLRGRQGILERYILEMYFYISERCSHVTWRWRVESGVCE